MNVLIIPEDFRKDQYLIKPLIEKLLSDLGKPHAKVRVCNNPLLGGVEAALNMDKIQEIVDLYPMVNLFILCVDRDGKLGRRSRLNQIEENMGQAAVFLAENAWEELETWVLAGLTIPTDWSWNAVRSEISVKELYFEPLAAQLNVSNGPGGGRKALGELAAKKLDAIILKCPEDFGQLASRIKVQIDPQ